MDVRPPADVERGLPCDDATSGDAPSAALAAGARVPPRRVGIVIRTLNESELIGRCLETLGSQRGDLALDIVVVDSGSTDGTVEIARSHGHRVLDLDPADFDYSKALNLGIEAVDGDVVVSLSAHAIPVDDGWLETMVAPFADPEVAGVASRQVPWPGAPWQEVHRLQHQFADVGHVRFRGTDAVLVFSNAASAIRRVTWRDEPFLLPAAEDLEWAQRVIAAGWSVVYEGRAAVYHSHHESPRAQALRLIDINRVLDPDASPRRRRAFREGAGILVRDSAKILGLDEPVRRKLAYLVELVQMVFFYVADFAKAGTTAERRAGVEL